MAADWGKEAKTFVVPEGKTGNKHNVLGSLFGRRRTVDRNEGVATDHRYVFFGLWSKDDTYSLVQSSKEEGAVFRRTHKSTFNGFRTKDTEYYPDRGKKSEDRRYFGGLFTSGVGYDTDGEVISRSDGDFMSKTTWSKSTDSRTQTLKQDELFGWYGKKQESLALPGDTAAAWRTMERRIGSYNMKIETSKNGAVETRTHGFGRALGKNWLFSRTSVYNFETGIKTTTYKGLFGLRDRGGDGKDRPISPKEMQKHQERVAQRERVSSAWERQALGLSGTDSVRTRAPDHSAMFEQRLRDLGSGRGGGSKASLDAWLNGEVERHAETLSGKKRAEPRSPRMSFGKELDPIAFGESASQMGDGSIASPSTPPRRSMDHNGVPLPPDTPKDLLPGNGGKIARLSEDNATAPDKRTRFKSPAPSREVHPSDKDIAGIVAETAPAPGRKVARLKNTSWKTNAAVLSDDEGSVTAVPTKRTPHSTPAPTREGRPSDKDLAGIVESTPERARKPAATLKNTSWGTGAADIPDSDDDSSVRSRERYQKPKREYDDRSSERNRSSVSSLGFE